MGLDGLTLAVVAGPGGGLTSTADLWRARGARSMGRSMSFTVKVTPWYASPMAINTANVTASTPTPCASALSAPGRCR